MLYEGEHLENASRRIKRTAKASAITRREGKTGRGSALKFDADLLREMYARWRNSRANEQLHDRSVGSSVTDLEENNLLQILFTSA